MPQVTGWISQNPANQRVAMDALEVLHKHYPGHSWFIRIDGGVLVIYNYAIDGRMGMIRHLKDISSDYTTFANDIARAAGELLERAKLRRGRAQEGVVVTAVDGIPQHRRRLQ
jgi:hypothetical protein